MKRKILTILILLFSVFLVTSCNKKDETKENEDTIVEEEILEGIVDDYKFTVTDEETDRVRIQMNNGDVMLAVLSNEDTPITIANFKKLVSEHFYDGLTFHRVISEFMIQGGDPDGDGTGGSKKTIKGEFSSNGVKNNLKHTKGVLSMARSSDPNSASSQFFIMHGTATHLDGSYAAFGKVFAGLDVLDKIASVEVVDNGYGEVSKPVKKQVIKSIRFVTVEKAN